MLKNLTFDKWSLSELEMSWWVKEMNRMWEAEEIEKREIDEERFVYRITW